MNDPEDIWVEDDSELQITVHDYYVLLGLATHAGVNRELLDGIIRRVNKRNR